MTTTKQPTEAFWRGRRVLVTGHTGFKGAWLCLWLRRMGAEVAGLALAPTEPSLFGLAELPRQMESHVVDVRNGARVAEVVASVAPEVVVHLAAQAIVAVGHREPVETFATNVMGTVHVLEALRSCETARAVVIATTDKVYRSAAGPALREEDALGAVDPYGASKGASELVAASYRASFLEARGVRVATARAGNVIGGGDWGEGRLVPDAVRAWSAGRALEVRRPDAVRPWQHVLEVLRGYLVLAERLASDPYVSGAFNFGPEEGVTVRTVVELARTAFGGGEVKWGVPAGLPEVERLVLDASHARRTLGVAPRWELAEAVRRTMEWYAALARGEHASTLCEADLAAYAAAEG